MWLVNVHAAGVHVFSGRMRRAQDAVDSAIREACFAERRGVRLDGIEVNISRDGGQTRVYDVTVGPFGRRVLRRDDKKGGV